MLVIINDADYDNWMSGAPNITLASALGDGTVRIWNAYADKVAARFFHGHHDEVDSIAFSPRGTRIDGLWLKQWGFGMHSPAKQLLGRYLIIVTRCIFPNGNRFASAAGSSDRMIRIWKTRAGTDKITPPTTECLYTDSSGILLGYQWMLDLNEESLVWVPPDHHTDLWKPSGSQVIRNHSIRFGLSWHYLGGKL